MATLQHLLELFPVYVTVAVRVELPEGGLDSVHGGVLLLLSPGGQTAEEAGPRAVSPPLTQLLWAFLRSLSVGLPLREVQQLALYRELDEVVLTDVARLVQSRLHFLDLQFHLGGNISRGESQTGAVTL